MTSTAGRSIAWVAMLVGSLVALRLSATGALSPPPIASVDGLTRWTDAREAPAAAIALVRFVAELAAWYLLGLTVLYTLAAALRSGGVAAVADALAAPGAARLVRGGLGLGLLATTAAGAAVGSDPPGAAAPTAERSTATMRPIADSGDGTARMVPRAAEQPPPPEQPPLPETTPAPAPLPATWTVEAGESMWSIAEDLLGEALGHTPTVAEVDPFWRSLVERNRDRLADRDDPDVIHPGQVFEIPVPPTPG